MLKDILSDVESRMHKAVDAFRVDLTTIRTGRASPALVDRMLVEYYNVPTPLQQLAVISTPDAQTIVIRPYAASDIGAIEKAIAKSDIGLTPNNDGQQIRLIIPPLTEDRRRDLTKQVGRRAEEARVAISNIRRDEIAMVRELEKEGEISEDDSRRAQDQIQDKTNAYVKKIDEIAREKDEEIMRV